MKIAELLSNNAVQTVQQQQQLSSGAFLECAGTESTRQDIFGDANPSLEVLTDEPRKAVLVTRRTL